jgi:hypothetical protein
MVIRSVETQKWSPQIQYFLQIWFNLFYGITVINFLGLSYIMSESNEKRDSDAEDKSDATDATDSGTDIENYYSTSKDNTPWNESNLILNSQGNTEGTQKAIDDRHRREKNTARRLSAAAKNALDPEVRKKAKLKAQKQAEKELAAEAKADLKAQKLHQRKLKTAMDAAIKKRKPNKNFTPREVSILMIAARKILPCGADDWESVLLIINSMLDEDEPRRDAATWKALLMRKKNTTKPTGSATIPEDVRIYFIVKNFLFLFKMFYSFVKCILIMFHFLHISV